MPNMPNNLVKCVTYEEVDRLWVEPCGELYSVYRMRLGGRGDYLGSAYARDIVAAWLSQ